MLFEYQVGLIFANFSNGQKRNFKVLSGKLNVRYIVLLGSVINIYNLMSWRFQNLDSKFKKIKRFFTKTD